MHCQVLCTMYVHSHYNLSCCDYTVQCVSLQQKSFDSSGDDRYISDEEAPVPEFTTEPLTQQSSPVTALKQALVVLTAHKGARVCGVCVCVCVCVCGVWCVFVHVVCMCVCVWGGGGEYLQLVQIQSCNLQIYIQGYSTVDFHSIRWLTI